MIASQRASCGPTAFPCSAPPPCEPSEVGGHGPADEFEAALLGEPSSSAAPPAAQDGGASGSSEVEERVLLGMTPLGRRTQTRPAALWDLFGGYGAEGDYLAAFRTEVPAFEFVQVIYCETDPDIRNGIAAYCHRRPFQQHCRQRCQCHV